MKFDSIRVHRSAGKTSSRRCAKRRLHSRRDIPLTRRWNFNSVFEANFRELYRSAGDAKNLGKSRLFLQDAEVQMHSPRLNQAGRSVARNRAGQIAQGSLRGDSAHLVQRQPCAAGPDQTRLRALEQSPAPFLPRGPAMTPPSPPMELVSGREKIFWKI